MSTARKETTVNEQDRPKTIGPNDQAAMVVVDDDPIAAVMGAYRQTHGISQRLKWAMQNAHLVSPAGVCTTVPAGHNVSLTAVYLDVDNDVYRTGSRYALSKHALFAIADAAGVCWDTEASRRLDDRSDPRYVHWHAVGAWQNLDGTVLAIDGDAEMDLRDGSAQVQKIYEEIKREGRTPEEILEAGRIQVRDTRAKILRHAQTKAQLAAIRKHLKIRSYSSEELSLPFVVARLSYDGLDADPEIERENKRAIRDLALGGARRLFGARAAESLSHALQAPPGPKGHTPPPVGSVPVEDDGGDVIDVRAEVEPPPVVAPRPAPPPPPAAPPPAPPPAEEAFVPPPAAAPRPRAAASQGAPTMRFGKSKGKTLAEASDRDLAWYASAVAENVNDPGRAQYRRANEAHLGEIRAEQARRTGRAPAAQTTMPTGAAPPAGHDDRDVDEIPF